MTPDLDLIGGLRLEGPTHTTHPPTSAGASWQRRAARSTTLAGRNDCAHLDAEVPSERTPRHTQPYTDKQSGRFQENQWAQPPVLSFSSMVNRRRACAGRHRRRTGTARRPTRPRRRTCGREKLQSRESARIEQSRPHGDPRTTTRRHSRISLALTRSSCCAQPCSGTQAAPRTARTPTSPPT